MTSSDASRRNFRTFNTGAGDSVVLGEAWVSQKERYMSLLEVYTGIRVDRIKYC
jgi:hypothetical protein